MYPFPAFSSIVRYEVKRLSIACLLALVFSSTGCVSSRTPHARGEDATQAVRSLARGVTMPELFDRSENALWVTYQQLDVFREIRNVGFDAVRIPVDFERAQHQPANGHGELSDIWLMRVERVVRQALRAKLAVVVTARMNADISTPEAQQQLIADWSQTAWFLRTMDGRVYFEPLENPNSGLSDSAWSRLAEEIRLAIRLSNPDRTLIVGAAEHYSPAHLAQLDLPPDPNLLFAFSYDKPTAFTRQEKEDAPSADVWDGARWDGTDEERRQIESDLNDVARWAKAHNRQLLCASFSATSRADPESRMRWTHFVARALETRNIAWSYRYFSGPDGVFDRDWRIWRQPLVNTLLDK